MGWFWESSAPSNPTGAAANPPQPSQAPTPTPPPPSSADAADSEMANFLEMIQSEIQNSKPADQPSSSAGTTRPSPADAKGEEKRAPPQRAAGKTAASQAISESLLPTEMSCQDAFDYAWHCHTPGSQWNAVYRYGSIRPCSELWEDFWFCMRTKSYKPDLKAAVTREHYRVKELAKYGPGKPSSEDVWESRDEKVAPGTAFGERVDDLDENDREWQMKEIERRRAVREGMGFGNDSQSRN